MAILFHGRICTILGGPWSVVIRSMLRPFVDSYTAATMLSRKKCGAAGAAWEAWGSPADRSGQPDAHELPTGIGREKVPIGWPDMRDRGGTRSTAQHKLVGHKFAVILPNRARCCGVPRIGGIVTLGPLPDISKHLGQWSSSIGLAQGDGMKGLLLNEMTPDWQRHRRDFPFDLGRQARLRPTGIGIRFVVTDVTHGFGFLHRLHASKSHHPPAAIPQLPIQWGFPSFALDRIPPHGKPQLRPFIPIVGHKG